MNTVSNNKIAVNVTVDDFDSPIIVTSEKWSTPDPSNKTSLASASMYFGRTYHRTNVSNELKFRFNGTAIYVYGEAGPSFGNFSTRLIFDNSSGTASESHELSAFAETKKHNFLLYNRTGLSQNRTYTLILTNLANSKEGKNDFLFDYLQFTSEIAPVGTNLRSVTIEEDDKRLKYTGKWTSKSGSTYSGGKTRFTNENQTSVSLQFNGSAIYAYGDTSANRGWFDVFLDGVLVANHKSVVGCGMSFHVAGGCEKKEPSLHFFAGGLDGKEHNITIQNRHDPSAPYPTFFDLDRFVITTQSTIGGGKSAAGKLEITAAFFSIFWGMLFLHFFLQESMKF